MKCLVVYFSRTGNTRAVAEKIASEAGADIEEIVENKDRSGVIGWLKAGKDAMTGSEAVIAAAKNDPHGYDVVFVGTPIWAWTVVPAVKTYLKTQGSGIKDAVFFATQGGSGAERAFKEMEAALGKKPKATVVLIDRDVKAGKFDALKSLKNIY